MRLLLAFLLLSLAFPPLLACEREINDFCQGDLVIDPNGEEATIISFEEDGQVNLRSKKDSHLIYQQKRDVLAKTFGCLEKYKCVGDTVINLIHESALIRGIFQNGTLALAIETNQSLKYRTLKGKDVAVTKGCLDFANLCVGDVVTDEDYDEATIKGIFTGEGLRITLSLNYRPTLIYSRHISQVYLHQALSPWREPQ